MGRLDEIPGKQAPNWVGRTQNALTKILQNDCNQSFDLDDWVGLLKEYLEEVLIDEVKRTQLIQDPTDL